MVSSKAALVVLSTALASSGVGAQLIRLGGVNTAGYDFTVVSSHQYIPFFN